LGVALAFIFRADCAGSAEERKLTGPHFCKDMANEISIEVDGKTIRGSYEVNRGKIMVSGGILGGKSAPLGAASTTELLARRLLRELYVESRLGE
jgi:hypothetical protein